MAEVLLEKLDRDADVVHFGGCCYLCRTSRPPPRRLFLTIVWSRTFARWRAQEIIRHRASKNVQAKQTTHRREVDGDEASEYRFQLKNKQLEPLSRLEGGQRRKEDGCDCEEELRGRIVRSEGEEQERKHALITALFYWFLIFCVPGPLYPEMCSKVL